MCQLAREYHLNICDNYIQAISWGSEQLAAKANCLKFENKGLIKALKAKRKKRNRNKKLNLLDEKDDSLQLFSLSRIQIAHNFAHNKEVEKEHQKKDIKEKKSK